MPITLLNPWALLLAFALLPIWVGPWRARGVHALLRSAALLLLVVALGHPVLQSKAEQEYNVLVLDQSQSVRPAPPVPTVWQEQVDAIVAVDGQTPAGWRVADSDLEVALQRAAARIPAGAAGRILMVGDGLARAGFPGAAISSLWNRDIRLSWLRSSVAGDLRVVGADLPGEGLRVGRSSNVVAHVEGSGQIADVVLRSGADGAEQARVEGIQIDGPTAVTLAWTPAEAGFVNYSLAVELRAGADAAEGNETWTSTAAVQDPWRIAYLGERMQGGAERLNELLGAGFEIAQADAAAGLDGYAGVVLDDIPAARLPQAWQQEVMRGVRERGLGLVMAGGEASFGPGGYHDQPIADVLPVEMVQKEEKRDPSTSLVLIIDTSGSMGGNRVQLAKQVSRLAIRRLLPHDKVGIVEFYGAKRWAVPLQPASNSIEIERALNRLDAGGGTVILPAIEEAWYGLQNVSTRYKHVLILTDGGVEQGAFEPLVRRMADDGINVSTVLIGPDAHSEFLVNIANWGQGRFYSVPNRFNLPEILLKQPASAKLPAYRAGQVNLQAWGGRGWWGDVDVQSLPPLTGYVETRSRPGAEVLLETVDQHHPLLASWRDGLGTRFGADDRTHRPGQRGLGFVARLWPAARAGDRTHLG
ncbi:MAG: VWA domain-containing protein [Planctomycetota bacterium]